MRISTIALVAALGSTVIGAADKAAWSAGGIGKVSGGPLGKEGRGQSMHDRACAGDTGPPL